MARRRNGPRPLPADVIELHGNRSKLSKAELEARRELEVKAEPVKDTDPPKHLSPMARECWRRHAPELDRLGLLTRLDLGSFELACESYAIAVSALEAMRPRRADGEVDGRRRGYEVVVVDHGHGGTVRRHPALTAFNMAANTYRSFCSEFGMTPSSRVTLRPAAGRGAPSSSSSADDDDAFDFGT